MTDAQQQKLPTLLSEEEFVSLSPTQQNLWIYKTLYPMATDYAKGIIIKNFGIGLGGIIFSICVAGGSILSFADFIKTHFFR